MPVRLTPAEVEQRLVFVISPPRAGSTLLQRMLGAHDAVATLPEPHLITPLAFLGYHDTVDAAPYDHVNGAEAIRAFVDALPGAEADYLDALRAYATTLYGRALVAAGKERFVDKTPAYALVLPFLTRLFPRARYVLLTRHPLAVFSSYAQSFYDGDWQAAHAFNPVLERYVPALGRQLRGEGARVPWLQVGYEALVASPEAELEKLFSFLDLPNDPEAVRYGDKGPAKAGMGDPIQVNRQSAPTTASVEKWAAELAHDADKRRLAEGMIGRLSDADLAAWGHPREALWAPLEAGAERPPPQPPRNDYTLQRRVMLAARSQVRRRPAAQQAVRRLRYYCDVLLRDSLNAR
ncbi:MAG: sulfotransferase [Myxococcota bacterium]